MQLPIVQKVRSFILNETELSFEDLALEVFTFQYENNSVYRKFCDLLNRAPGNVDTLEDVPFLPVEFFKDRMVLSMEFNETMTCFTSSGTTGSQVSKHYVPDLSLYDLSLFRGFQEFYGDHEGYEFFFLLPSYLERSGSSLIHMARRLHEASGSSRDPFYLDSTQRFREDLKKAERKVFLLGVTFALLDLASQDIDLSNAIVMDTGGMKGRRKEIVREEVHAILQSGLHCGTIHSEYGMTELLSQAYSAKDGIFHCPSWMRLTLREMEDPLLVSDQLTSGGVNVIDLANVLSCSFLATQDIGRKSEKGMEILGRFDHSDIRGCNLMAV